MYTGFLHTHKLVVVLFLLIYLLKAILLLTNKKDALATFTKKVKVPEMIISVLFLATGGYMLSQLPEIKTLQWVKLAAVFASIPLAVIGFKKHNKALAVLSVLLIIAAYGLAEMSKRRVEKVAVEGEVVTDASAANYDALVHGKALFNANCVQCHGENGDMQKVGAKNLQTSELGDSEVKNIILNGKNSMPPYSKVLNETEVAALVQYVKSFRK